MALDLDKIKAEYKLSGIVGQRVSLKKNGREFEGCCPFHKEKTPSFTVNDDKKFYHCFGCGENGDIFDFMMNMDNIDLKEAAKRITGTLPSDVSATPYHDPYADYEPIPFPKELCDLKAGDLIENIWNPKREGTPKEITSYRPQMVHTYTTKDGDVIGYVFRVEFKGGRKITPQIMYCKKKSTGEQGLCHYPMPEPRSVYNIKGLHDNPSLPVIIMEGEKCVDVAAKVMSGFIVIGWSGGTNALNSTDWSVLKGRNVVIFPDADPVGKQCAKDLLTKIYSIAKGVKTVTHKDKPKGWDAADAIEKEGMDKNKLLQYILDNTKAQSEEVKKDKAAEAEVKEEAKKEEEKQARKDTKEQLKPDQEFRLLGYTDKKFYFLRYKTGVVKGFTGSNLLSLGSLLEIAPFEYWEKYYLSNFKGRKAGLEAAANELISRSEDHGYFTRDIIRGRGSWHDDGNHVFHCGDYLIVNGHKVDIKEFGTNFIYQHKPRLDVYRPDPVQASDANKLVKLLEGISRWSSPVNAKLLAGWIAAAPIAGSLPWRSHLYIFAPKGSGKSQVIDIVNKILSGLEISVQGSTTEAGVRQQLDSDALPIVFDESEPQDEKRAQAMQEILFLARQSSSANGGAILKGSVHGDSISYKIRSSFLMSSIVPCLKHDADESRFIQMRLLRNGVKGEEHDAREWTKFQAAENELLTPAYCKRLMMRSITLIPQITHNQKIFQTEARKVFGDARKADLYSMVFAGLYSLYSSNKITNEDANKWIKEQQWDVQIQREDEHSDDRMIDVIMQKSIKMSMRNDMVVSEMIECIMKEPYSFKDYKEILARHRLKVDSQNGVLWFASNSEFMDSSLAKTPWSTGWRNVLASMDGAVKSKSTISFAGKSSRAIGIKLTTVLGKD